MERPIGTFSRIAAGLLVPVAFPLLALGLHQSGVITISWTGGAVVVILVIGFCCGLLLRSLHAATHIFVLWAIWAVVAVFTDNGRSDPPVEAGVFTMLLLLVVPGALASTFGALVAKAWQSRSGELRWAQTHRAGTEQGDR